MSADYFSLAVPCTEKERNTFSFEEGWDSVPHFKCSEALYLCHSSWYISPFFPPSLSSKIILFHFFGPVWLLSLFHFTYSSQTIIPGHIMQYFWITTYDFSSVHCVPQGGAPLKDPFSKQIHCPPSNFPFLPIKKCYNTCAVSPPSWACNKEHWQ